jgi:hypothetical protein
MHVPSGAVEQMLGAIPDLKLRQMLANVVSGKAAKQVRCLSDICQGRVIAHIHTNGQVVPVRDEDGEMWLRASRSRFDKNLGFECNCGNDSRRAASEMEHLDLVGSAPTRDGLEAIWNKLQANPPRYREIDGRLEVDGFVLEAVS